MVWVISIHLHAQKQITERSQNWVGYLHQSRFSEKWGAWLDVQYRQIGLNEPTITLFRPAVSYYLNNDFRLMAGVNWIHYFAPLGKKQQWDELSPWQQIWWRTAYNAFYTTQWLRLESRFIQKVENDRLTDEIVFFNRLRYNFYLQIPLNSKQLIARTWYVGLQNEVFFNLGKDFTYNIFDQNRAFVGVGYYFNNHTNLQAGYMNLFQQTKAGNQYFNNHTLRVFLFHNIDFRKKA